MATTGSSVQLSVFSVFCLPAVRGGMPAVHPIAAPCPPVGYCVSKRRCGSLSPWMCRRRPCSRARYPNAHSFSERRIQHPAPPQARRLKRPRLGSILFDTGSAGGAYSLACAAGLDEEGLPCKPDARARESVTDDGGSSQPQFAPVPDFLPTIIEAERSRFTHHRQRESRHTLAPQVQPVWTA